jgi:hypothetical protein
MTFSARRHTKKNPLGNPKTSRGMGRRGDSVELARRFDGYRFGTGRLSTRRVLREIEHRTDQKGPKRQKDNPAKFNHMTRLPFARKPQRRLTEQSPCQVDFDVSSVPCNSFLQLDFRRKMMPLARNNSLAAMLPEVNNLFKSVKKAELL